MKLSIIIVNYNVPFFLEQCLQSVFIALKDIDAEVFVVDNNSVDGSVAMIKEKFKWVNLVENDRNLGFSVANNIAIRKSVGQYVLLLNPDTIVEEDTFIKVLSYLDDHPDAGAVGVKMIDGKGNFLPESKRGLPTPWVAFYKIFGLSKLFPNSKKFGKYHLSYLDEDSIHDVDVLCGAFMMIRKKVLDDIGLLDETFFMYGEDVDLSHRIKKTGYRVVYFPLTTIIHYKGESTRKSSLNYVFLFYKAMQIFAQKHLSGGSAKWLNLLINIAIYFRASLSVIKRIGIRILLPLADAILIYVTLAFLAKFWGNFWFHDVDYYPSAFFTIFLPACISIWLISLLFAGAYDKPIQLSKTFQGILAGTVIILIAYALLPKEYHYSRVVILLGSVMALLVSLVSRIALSFSRIKEFSLRNSLKKKILIAGSLAECERVNSIINKLNIQPDFLSFVSPSKEASPKFLGSLEQLSEIVKIYKINEIIYCSRDITSSDIISSMLNLAEYGCEFKIAPVNSEVIIGSNSINTVDLYVYSINSITSARNLRLKRTFDLLISLLLLLCIPIWFWLKKKRGTMLREIFNVILNNKTWIGYPIPANNLKNKTYLKPGVYNLRQFFPESNDDPVLIQRVESAYVNNYYVITDVKFFFKAFCKSR